MAFNKIQKYQKYFRKLVELEREEEMHWHMREIINMSPRQRQKAGRALLDLSTKAAGRGLGGSYLIKFGRRKLPKTDISVGDLVICSTDRPSGDEMQGTVVEKTGSSVTVAYNNSVPKYMYGRGLRLDLFSNDITFQRMLEALQELGKNQRMQNILLERQRFRTQEIQEPEIVNPELNEAQWLAVKKTLATPDFFLIHGPPGTGKTTTLVEAITQHVKVGYRILATADSNIAVDNMVEKLARWDIHVVRIGNPARVTPALIKHTLDHIILKHPHFHAAQEMWEQIDMLRVAQQEYIPATGKNTRGYSDDQLKAMVRRGRSGRGISLEAMQSMTQWIRLQEKINELADKAKEYTDKAAVKILKEAEVICCTNSTAGSDLIDKFLQDVKSNFDVVFLDEASQSMEPASLIPIVKSNKFIMSGDHKQLPPTILNREAQQALQFTMFERMLDRYGDEVRKMLVIQYRMHERIMAFSNKHFYDGELKAHPSVAAHTIEDMGLELQKAEQYKPWLKAAVAPTEPVIFLDTTNINEPFEFQKKKSTSYANIVEAEVVEKLWEALKIMGAKGEDIGIITPYDDQVELLKEKLEEAEGLEIRSVDGFQGREKEIVIISLVRANEKGEIGFLKDLKRLNVAITRARRKLIIIGHSATLEQHDIFYEL